MANRRKYLFDDFTLVNYRRLIQLAKSKGFHFILHKDAYIPERKDIIWRHDVEFEPDIALEMAKVESDFGVKASYFFQLHSPFYNLLDSHYSAVLHRIYDLGHLVGLHFDCNYWGVSDEDQLNKFITIDKNCMETYLGVLIDTFSFHNTNSFTQHCQACKYGGLLNVYSSFFKDRYKYCSDSLGYWRYDRLEDVLKNENVRHLQVLTHDANWSDEVLSPRKRFSKAVNDKATRLIEGQINGLHKKGLLCPDDNED